MHKSRLCGLIIDCRTEDLGKDAAFWGRALGREPLPDDSDPRYVVLRHVAGAPYIELQRVDHQSRVHIDIETDDVEAEVRRLEGLGARRLQQIKDWRVMEAPSGHRFCVVPAIAPDFAEKANTWD